MNARSRQVLVLTLATLFLLTFIPQEASAFPYRIEGYLNDGGGNPIIKAEIEITGLVYDPGVQDYVNLVQTKYTDTHGYFRFDIGAGEPGGYDMGSEIKVSYTVGDGSVSKSITIDGLGSWANLTYEKIPSLTEILFSPAGLIGLVVIASVFFVGLYARKSKKEEEESKDTKNAGRRRR